MITEMNDLAALVGGEVAAVDELVQSPGWRVVLQMIENKIALLEDEMGQTSDPLKVLQLVRTWQSFRGFYYSLKRGGQTFVDEMERQKQMEGPEGAFLRQMQSMRPKFVSR